MVGEREKEGEREREREQESGGRERRDDQSRVNDDLVIEFRRDDGRPEPHLPSPKY